ncbi:hypothetical protein PCASD_20202 [Puccinia coronata f. sp. avenae]|uniref:Uncharacterized protein n=1 Tax=Puccinia coronata f. sp. avenae TaxID=200324 RepID=A0A2N5SDS8_9BASI|nr:hypothetical protein PCASD_20202 [Puccinia coronata f. sp. avenae]
MTQHGGAATQVSNNGGGGPIPPSAATRRDDSKSSEYTPWAFQPLRGRTTSSGAPPTTPLRQGRGVAAGPIGSPKRSLRPVTGRDIAVNAKGAVTGVALVTVVCIASIGTLPICWVTGPREGRHFDEPFVPPCTFGSFARQRSTPAIN